MTETSPKKTGRAVVTGETDEPGSTDDAEAPGFWTPLRSLLAFGGVVLVVQVALTATSFIPAPHNGGDNAAYVALAHSLLTETGYVDVYDPAGLPHTKYPPVLPLLLSVLVAAGAKTWTALKAVPLLFTSLGVLGAYLWAAQRRGAVFGAGVATLVAMSTATLWSSQWILSEPPFVAFTLLALWAADLASGTGKAPGLTVDETEAGPEGLGRADPAGTGAPDLSWLTLAGALAIFAYFTRSAGLPLLLALGLWLMLRRAWATLAGFAVVAGAPALLWWLRARQGGDLQYMSEFWMVNPYDPGLGTVGVGGLLARVADNVVGYVGTFVPQGMVGSLPGPWLPVIGVALTALALVGWVLRVRDPGRRGLAELFIPLYSGLILVWPAVWSGDRFALPLFPLLLFYAGEALLWAVRTWKRQAAPLAAVAGFVILALPALGSWSRAVETARTCTDAVEAAGAYACYGPRWMEFERVARWSGLNLPDGAAVLSRKPRIFYVLSGVPSRTFRFSEDPDLFEADAREAGARYVVLDYVDRQASRYVGAVVRSRPELFCSVRSFGTTEGASTQLLGILPEGAEGGGEIVEEPDGAQVVSIPPCPPPLDPVETTPVPTPTDLTIPLLARGG